SAEAEQAEESAQHVFSLSDPGDRFDVEWMQGEKPGDERAAPKRAGHLLQKQEQEERVSSMKDQAGEVVPPRLKSEKLHVQHVGNPGERVPIGRVTALHSPRDAFPLDSAKHLRVFGDVLRIVVIDKLVVEHRPESGQRGGSQE